MARARISDAVGVAAVAEAVLGLSGGVATAISSATDSVAATPADTDLAATGDSVAVTRAAPDSVGATVSAAVADSAPDTSTTPTPAATAEAAPPAIPRQTLATAVRYSLQLLAERAQGNTVEVRVPPFAAVQCIEGPGHTRGTPPNVIEMNADTWIRLATGSLDWMTGVESGRIHASGQRADLRGYVPLAGLPRG